MKKNTSLKLQKSSSNSTMSNCVKKKLTKGSTIDKEINDIDNVEVCINI